MAADIKLNDNQVIAEAWDFAIKSKDRQDPYDGEHRRALVHDKGDGLTINYGHDYQNGINLVGVKKISPFDPKGTANGQPVIIADDSRGKINVDGNLKINGALTSDDQVRIKAWDLCLDGGKERRTENNNKHRRALVHNHSDGLTINWGEDYPDGVTILGLNRIVLNHPKGAWGSTCIIEGNRLQFKGIKNISFDKPVDLDGALSIKEVSVKEKLTIAGYDVIDYISKIRSKVNHLEEIIGNLRSKVKELEDKIVNP